MRRTGKSNLEDVFVSINAETPKAKETVDA